MFEIILQEQEQRLVQCNLCNLLKDCGIESADKLSHPLSPLTVHRHFQSESHADTGVDSSAGAGAGVAASGQRRKMSGTYRAEAQATP